MTIRLLLCDDQDIVTEGMGVILRTVRDFAVVGVARDGAEAVDLVAETQPDVVLMDLRMPVMNGIQATRKIRERFPQTRVLVLTTYDDDEWVFDAIRAGAAGYLLKDTGREQIIAAIRGTAEGATYVDPQVAGKLFTHIAQGSNSTVGSRSTLAVDLSEREREILRLLADGLPNGEIAERLHLSKGTVQNYVSSILLKLDVTDRTQAAVIALKHGLVGE
ncbi:MAG: response regulator transcription factor [Caldilineaceae bacterium]|nr:response regulator transcription factor [Caldilineaceae bacterium]MCB0189407.1 response regulator transcription factor [Caldilineaceae bacterium]